MEKSLLRLLGDVPWVQGMPSAARERILADAFETFHKKGEVIAAIGEPARSWIYVADGLLKVSAVNRAGRVIMYTGVPLGSWFGEGALVKRELRRYDIVAMRESRIIHVPGATFRWLLDTCIEFNHVVIAQLNERLSQYITMVDIDRLEDPVARVAQSLAVLFNPVLYPSMTAAVPLSQAELGELAGLARQTISAALKQLAKEGLIIVEYGSLVVKNVPALRDYEARDRG
jgi:CRP-like cAMP-binding protein